MYNFAEIKRNRKYTHFGILPKFTLIMFYRHTFILYTLMALIKEYTKNDTFTKKKRCIKK